MTKQRPVIHSRDHEYGGADPVRTSWEFDGSGEGTGAFPFVRVSMSGDQTIGATGLNSFPPINFDVVHNDYPEVFEMIDAFVPGVDLVPRIIKSGVYAVTFRLWLDSTPSDGFSTVLNGIDVNELLYYEKYQRPLGMFDCYDSYVFRAIDSRVHDPAIGHAFWLMLYATAADSDVVITGGDYTGSYLELTRLGSADVTDLEAIT